MSKANPPSFALILSATLRKLREAGLPGPALVRLLPHITSAQTLHNAASVVEGRKRANPLSFKVVAALGDLALSRKVITDDEYEELLYSCIRKSAETSPIAMRSIERLEQDGGAPNGRGWLKERRLLIEWRLKYLAEKGE